MAALSQMNNLIKLDLSYSTVNDLNLASYRLLINLKSLNLNGTEGLRKWFISLKILKIITIIVFIYQSKVNPSNTTCIEKKPLLSLKSIPVIILYRSSLVIRQSIPTNSWQRQKATGVPITK